MHLMAEIKENARLLVNVVTQSAESPFLLEEEAVYGRSCVQGTVFSGGLNRLKKIYKHFMFCFNK